jgi:hypothetical protein
VKVNPISLLEFDDNNKNNNNNNNDFKIIAKPTSVPPTSVPPTTTPAPAKNSTPVIVTPVTEEFDETTKQNLIVLEDMGFKNVKQNAALLKKYEGDVIKVLQELLDVNLPH